MSATIDGVGLGDGIIPLSRSALCTTSDQRARQPWVENVMRVW
jgi:hypothetical protein